MARAHPVRRRIGAWFLGMAIVAIAATPVLAAPPTREVFDMDDPVAEAFWSDLLTAECGVPVAVDFRGSVTVHTFTDRAGAWKRQIDKYWIRDAFTNTATGASIVLKDVGPDLWSINRRGELVIAITGRSLTGSGVIGRVVINLDTGEVDHIAGRSVGSVADQVCPAIS